jgi:hypothetical protein
MGDNPHKPLHGGNRVAREDGTGQGRDCIQGSSASMMTSGLARGIPIIEVSRRLGHKSIEFHPQDLSPPRAQFLGRGRTALDDAYEENQRQQPPAERC